MKLTPHERKRAEDRCFDQYHSLARQPSYIGTWAEYWKANRKYVFKNALTFKRLLSPQGFERYFSEPDLNPLTIHNVETMNG